MQSLGTSLSESLVRKKKESLVKEYAGGKKIGRGSTICLVSSPSYPAILEEVCLYVCTLPYYREAMYNLRLTSSSMPQIPPLVFGGDRISHR